MCRSRADGGQRCAAHHPATRAALSMQKALHRFDDAQIRSVWAKSRDRARARVTAPTEQQWHEFVDTQIQQITTDHMLDQRTSDRVVHALTAARPEIPDATLYAAITELSERGPKARAALDRQVASAAALRGVPAAQVAARVDAYRRQYLTDFKALPDGQRPDPPAEWVAGYSVKDKMAVSSPQDPATHYAMFRCQAEPAAFPAAPGQRFASIDLETAGPEGRIGMEPQNGAIIEVGIVEYDAHGNPVGRYATLVHPGEQVLSAHGTGAVNVHHISPADVADAPGWEQVAGDVSDRLAGRVLLAQNARYEGTWLQHHLTAAGHHFDRHRPTVDTMTLARQHLSSLPTHRLSAICERFGVAYTDGHRAEHDARVTAQVFFRLRDHIFASWGADPARAGAPHPRPVTPGRPRGLQRRRGGDFDPATVVDDWTVPAAA